MPDISLSLRVLGYLDEDGLWAAHCLETDLVGFGSSFEKALDDLNDLTVLQVGLAVFKKQPSLLDHPAPSWVIETYSNLLLATLRNYPQAPKEPRHAIGNITMPKSPKKPSNFVLAGA